MRALSTAQLKELSRVIRDMHKAFTVNIGLGHLVPEADKRRLERDGLIRPDKTVNKATEHAFNYGFMSDALKEQKDASTTYKQFQSWLGEKRYASLTENEEAALESVKFSVAKALERTANKYEEAMNNVVVEADKNLNRRIASQVGNAVAESIERRKAVAEIARGLQKATKDATKNWTRIVVTEVNNAFQEGKVSMIQKSNKGRDPKVYKRVRPDACDECRDAYLLKSGVPRVFRLSELLANGSNVGKSRGERQATVSAFHPHCMCELMELPEGFVFDRKGNLHYSGL